MDRELEMAIEDAAAAVDRRAENRKPTTSKSKEHAVEELLSGCSCDVCLKRWRVVEVQGNARFKLRDGTTMEAWDEELTGEQWFQFKRLVNRMKRKAQEGE